MKLTASLRTALDWKRLKFIFCWVFAIGILAHGYCYFNGNFSHDSLFSIYEENQDINIAVGRFLRPVYRLLRGNFTLPVINGFLSLVFLSLAAWLLTDIMGIQRKSTVALTCGLLVTNATVTLMNATYLHDADAYMLSLFLALAGVWVALRLRHGGIYSVFFYFACLGVYQAYIDVAIYVFLMLALMRLLKGERVGKVYLDTLGNLVPILAAMVLYYIGVRVTQRVTGIDGGDFYNALSASSILSLGTLLKRLYNCLFSDALWLLLPNANNAALIRVVNLLMVLAAVWMTGSIIRSRRLGAASILGILGVLVAFPFGMNAITIISDMYHALTIFALYLSYVWVLVLMEAYPDTKKTSAGWGRLVCGFLACILIFDGCLFSNQSYLKKELESAATLSTFTRIISRMEATPGFVPGETRVAFVGLLLDGPLSHARHGFNYISTGMWQSYSTTYHDTYETYLNVYLGYPADCVDSKEIVEFEQMEEVAEMTIFPAEGSVRMVGDVMVVKLSDPLAEPEAEE